LGLRSEGEYLKKKDDQQEFKSIHFEEVFGETG
jgi:hypothetical protein